MTIMNRTRLSDILGCVPSTLDGMVKDGCPFLSRPEDGKGKLWSFDTSEVVKWIAQQAVREAVGGDGDGDEGALGRKARRARYMADIANAGLRELELEERLRNVVKVSDMIPVIEEHDAIVKSRIQAVPGRIGQPISILTSAAECTAMIKNELNEALEEICKDFSERLASLE